MTITRRGLVAAGLLAAGTRPALAALRWQVASGLRASNPQARLLDRFCDAVREGSGGTFQLHRVDEAQRPPARGVRQAVQAGQAQIGDMLLAANAGGEPLLELDAVPMLARTADQARRLAAVTRPAVAQRLQRDGLTLLYWAAWPGSGLFSRFTVDSPDALAGTRMRSMTAMGARVAALVGATVAPVEPEDVPYAFATRQAGVMLAPATGGVDNEAWRFARYFTPLRSSFPKSAVCVQTRALEALSTPRRALLQDAAARCEQAGWDELEAEQDRAQQQLIAHGMTLRPASPKLVEAFERIGAIILHEWLERAGTPGRRLLDAYREG